MCDQLRPFELGCYGNKAIKTPNIDKLAKNGTVFETAVTNTPVCTPARSSLLTGQYCRTCTGLIDNKHAHNGPFLDRKRLVDPSIAEELKKIGYSTALIGKWHVYTQPNLLGFDYALYPEIEHKYKGQTYYENKGNGFTVESFSNDYEVGILDKYIKEQKEEPFFLFYNISLPHQPILEGMPDKYTDLYDRKQVLLRNNVWQNGEMANSDFWFRVYCYSDFFWDWLENPDKVDYSKYPLSKEGFNLEDLTALYYGAIGCVDDTVGKMMEMLKRNEMDNNTIIVFVSDHGDNLGSHHMFNKDELIEESIRIPLIFYYPRKIEKQKNTDRITQIIDIFPTIIDMIDGDIPKSVQGQSLKLLLTGEKTVLDKNHAFIETPSHKIGIRTPKYKFGMKINEQTKEITNDNFCLYDIENDPYELNNLNARQEHESIRDELKEMLLEWHERTPWLKVP